MGNGKSAQERYYELMLLTELANSDFVPNKEIFVAKIKQIANEVKNDIMIEQIGALGIKSNEDTSKDLDSHAIR